jgi:Ni/Fe-hydrogenase 1 B-type cytochrome subunit
VTVLEDRAPARTPSPDEIVPIYVWDLVVRWSHWLIVLSMAVLAVTGFLIGHPVIVVTGRAGDHFLTGTVRAIHFYAAIVFTLSVLSRLLWMFIGPRHARWTEFVPVSRERRRGFLGTLEFYLFFRRTPPPFVGHNPVAGAAYTAVFALYLVMIGTGLGMYALSDSAGSPMRWFSFLVPVFGGTNMARWIHHVVMWLLLGFAVHHVYSGGLVSIVERNATMDSIISGWKFMPRRDLGGEAKGGRRG